MNRLQKTGVCILLIPVLWIVAVIVAFVALIVGVLGVLLPVIAFVYPNAVKINGR